MRYWKYGNGEWCLSWRFSKLSWPIGFYKYIFCYLTSLSLQGVAVLFPYGYESYLAELFFLLIRCKQKWNFSRNLLSLLAELKRNDMEISDFKTIEVVKIVFGISFYSKAERLVKLLFITAYKRSIINIKWNLTFLGNFPVLKLT